MQVKRALFYFILLGGTGITFYLSWLPDPVLGKYGFLPGWLARWTDAQVNDTVRTAIPLLFLGFISGYWLSITKQEWRWWMNTLFGLISVVLIAEIGQLTLPYRSFDWGDVAWGAAGSVSGLALAATGIWVIRFIIKK